MKLQFDADGDAWFVKGGMGYMLTYYGDMVTSLEEEGLDLDIIGRDYGLLRGELAWPDGVYEAVGVDVDHLLVVGGRVLGAFYRESWHSSKEPSAVGRRLGEVRGCYTTEDGFWIAVNDARDLSLALDEWVTLYTVYEEFV